MRYILHVINGIKNKYVYIIQYIDSDTIMLLKSLIYNYIYQIQVESTELFIILNE